MLAFEDGDGFGGIAFDGDGGGAGVVDAIAVCGWKTQGLPGPIVEDIALETGDMGMAGACWAGFKGEVKAVIGIEKEQGVLSEDGRGQVAWVEFRLASFAVAEMSVLAAGLKGKAQQAKGEGDAEGAMGRLFERGGDFNEGEGAQDMFEGKDIGVKAGASPGVVAIEIKGDVGGDLK